MNEKYRVWRIRRERRSVGLQTRSGRNDIFCAEQRILLRLQNTELTQTFQTEILLIYAENRKITIDYNLQSLEINENEGTCTTSNMFLCRFESFLLGAFLDCYNVKKEQWNIVKTVNELQLKRKVGK